MAIRKKDKHALSLTALQVQEIRHRYYINLHTSKVIAEDFQKAESTIKDAIYGKRGYAKIPDNIPQEAKDNRIQGRSLTATPASVKKREYRARRSGDNGYTQER